MIRLGSSLNGWILCLVHKPLLAAYTYQHIAKDHTISLALTMSHNCSKPLRHINLILTITLHVGIIIIIILISQIKMPWHSEERKDYEKKISRWIQN